MAALRRLGQVTFAVALLAGCRDPDRTRSALAEEVRALSRDQCLREGLEETERSRAVEGAAAGRIDPEAVARYRREIRARAEAARAAGSDLEAFCRIHRDTWRRHFPR